MTATKSLFSLHHWSVVGPNEDDNFEIVDQDGDVMDEATTLEDAIEACTEQATESYRQRLWDAITETDPDDFPLYILQAIADQLGHNAQTL